MPLGLHIKSATKQATRFKSFRNFLDFFPHGRRSFDLSSVLGKLEQYFREIDVFSVVHVDVFLDALLEVTADVLMKNVKDFVASWACQHIIVHELL